MKQKAPKNVTDFKPKELTPVPTEPTVESVMAPIPEPQQQAQAQPTPGQAAWLWLVEVLNNTRNLPCTIAEINPRMGAIAAELNELRALKEKK